MVYRFRSAGEGGGGKRSFEYMAAFTVAPNMYMYIYIIHVHVHVHVDTYL